MNAPICEVCLSSDILCKVDEEKLRKGIITATDVRISRSVYELSKHVKPLNDITIKKAIEAKNLIVIICAEGDASKIIGKSGVIVKKLSKHLGKPVRVIEEASDIKDFIQKLFSPVPLIGVNILYTPDKEIYRVKIGRRKTPISNETFKDIMKQVYGVEAEIVSG